MRTVSKALFIILTCVFFSAPVRAGVWEEPVTSYTLHCGQPGGRLIFSTTSDPKSFNPVVAKETSTTAITGFLFEGLTDTDPLTLEVIPCLAESWESENGKVWTFHLRRDVRWNDGQPFTADDVVFTYNQLIYNPDIPSSSRDIFTLEGKPIIVEKIDDYTVRFTLPSVFAPFLKALGDDILPRHKYEPLVEKKAFNFSMGLDARPRDIVGSGPFRLKQYVPGERVVLEKNPYYWKKDDCQQALPYLNEIIFVVVQDENAALLRFMEKEIDYFGMNPQSLAILGPRQEKDSFTIYNAGPALGTNFVVFNQHPGINPQTKKPFVARCKLKWFQDERFRKAVSWAIDRQKIIDVVFNGLGVAIDSPVSPANPLFYNPDVIRYSYDPDKARQLLAEAGFRDRDNDGIIEDSQGNKVEISFFTNGDNNLRIVMATLVKKDLENIGMKINFLPLEFNNLVTKLVASFDWEMILLGFTGGVEPHFGKNVWSYSGTLHAWNQSKQPLYPWEKEIESIFDQGVKTLDPAERKEFYDRWQYIVSDKLPLIYTATGYTLYAVRNKFGNVYPTVYGGAFGHIENVYILKQ